MADTQEQSPDGEQRRRISVRWALIAAAGGGVFGVTSAEGTGVAVTAGTAVVLALHAILE